eukprot:3707646-Pyramimonas_sp.AAC.1
MGLDSLTDSQRARLTLGNVTLFVTCRLIDVCRRVRVPAFLENPDRSLMWLAPRLISLSRGSDFSSARFHQCQFGAPWKKCTRVVSWNGGCLSRLQRWCHANGRICSRTGLQHQELAGRAPGGKHWTATAAAYPPALSKAIATSMMRMMCLAPDAITTVPGVPCGAEG